MYLVQNKLIQEDKMNFPIILKFKLLALNPQIYVLDSAEKLIYYIKQKFFKLKEEVTVFEDEAQTREKYKINADRIIDFSAAYHFTDNSGNNLGSVSRKGMKSIWSAHYEILDSNGNFLYTIKEENPWIKILDSLIGEVPVLGFFVGYFLNPKYKIESKTALEFRIIKSRSF